MHDVQLKLHINKLIKLLYTIQRLFLKKILVFAQLGSLLKFKKMTFLCVDRDIMFHVGFKFFHHIPSESYCTLSTWQRCLFIVWLGSDIIGSLPKAFPNKMLEFWPIPEHRTDAKVCRLPCLHVYYLLCENKKMLGLRSRLSDKPNALTYLLLNHFWAAMTQSGYPMITGLLV